MAVVPPGLATALQDRYRLDRELGQGGMATVYLAHDLKHGRNVALKVFRPELAATLGSERFLREITLTAQLNHPHILPLLDSGMVPDAGGERGGSPYYVMPYVEGESLRGRLNREKQLPLEDALQITREVADALGYANGHQVIHRDIKPENILLESGHAVVADFGIARAITAASGEKLTETGLAVGTPAYMSPEQAAGERDLDGRSDLYALGCVLYEMLAGQPPFTGATAGSIVHQHLAAPVPNITVLRPALPANIAAALQRALAKVPADRFGSAPRFAEALGPPASAVVTTPLAAAARARQVPRWAAWMAGGALVAAGAFALTLRQRAPDVLVLGKRVAVAAGSEWESWPSLSPDGRTVAYTRSSPTASEIVVQQVDGGSPVVVTAELPGLKFAQALSPDGGRLLFQGQEGLYVMPTLGGQARLVVPHPAGWGSWAPDGQRIVYPRRDTLFVRSLEQPDSLALAIGVGIHSPAWSPDGDWIAFVEGNPRFHTIGNTASSVIKLVRATGGVPVVVTDSVSLNTSPVWIPGRRALLFISDREGGRDIYQLAFKGSDTPQGASIRITTGLNPERISLSADGRRLVWSVFTQISNVWSIAIPARDSVPLSRARQVTEGTQNIEAAAVSPDGIWLYYDSDRSGNADIWRLPLAGGQPEQLTTDPAGDFLPAVSPDGREVAFHSLRNGSNNRDVFVMPARGGPAVQVSTSTGDDRTPAWSPDGRTLVWIDGYSRDSGLLVATRGDDGTWTAPRRYAVPRFSGYKVWTPDGRAIAVLDSAGIELVNTATGERTSLLPAGWPNAGNLVIGNLALSADGRGIYGITVDSLGRVRIGVMELLGGRLRTLVYADNPPAQGFRRNTTFAVQGGRFYLPLWEAKSDVWVAEVAR